MIQLWLRMTHIYGYKWVSVMGGSAVEDNELTDAAKTWQSGLIGITPEHIANGLRQCVASSDEWFPSLPKFRNMCLKRDDVPSVSELVDILLIAARSDENIVKRYQHPIAYAIVKSRGFDVLNFRFSNRNQCEDMIRPIYERLLVDGWEEFKPEHYHEVKRIAAPVADKSIGKKYIAEMRKTIAGA